MSLHSQIESIYRKKFLKVAQDNWDELSYLMARGNEFDNPDIGNQLNSSNKSKYFNKDYGKRVADKLLKMMPNSIDKKPLNILDVGCGFGQYACVLQEFGHTVLGILGGNWYLEDYKFLLNKLKVPYYEHDILDLSNFLKGIQYDIVLCSEILTLPSMMPLIRPITHQLLDVIKPTGRILVLNHSNKAISPTLEVFN